MSQCRPDGRAQPKLLVWPLAFAVPLLSGSLFSIEFLLTRVLSYLVWYNYVFVIISTAVLCMGLGGLWVQRRLSRDGSAEGGVSMWRLQLLLIGSFALIAGALYVNLFGEIPLFYIGLTMIPFALGGAVMSSIFARMAGIAHLVYFLDLSGTALFVYATVYVLSRYGMVWSLLLVLGALLAAELFLCLAERNLAMVAVPAALLVLPLMVSAANLSYVEQNFGNPLKNREKIGGYIRHGWDGKIEATKWDSLSRTDVVDIGDPYAKAIFMDGGSVSLMYRFDGDLSLVEGLKKTAAYLPYEIQTSPKVLAIGPGGGRDILLALLAGSPDITAVEINSSAVAAAREFSEYNGGIYDLPQVRTYIEDGRTFIEQTSEKYDTIYMGLVMTQSSAAKGLTMSENYIFTEQAMSSYLEHLTDSGQLVFLAHDQNDMVRIATTALAALGKAGIPYPDAIKQIAIFSKDERVDLAKHVHYPVVTIRKTPFTAEQSIRLLQVAARNGLIPVYLPGVYEKAPYDFATFASVKEFVETVRTDARPTTDDKPFFYNYARGIPSFVLLVLIASLLVGLGFFWSAYSRMEHRERSFAKLFSLIGIGFMAVEVALIQKNTLLLGHPTKSFLVTVPAMLAASGLGSMASKRLGYHARTLRLALGGGIAVIALVYWVGAPRTFSATPAARVAWVVGTSVFLGFLMGTQFPSAMSKLKAQGKENLIPFMWGVNGLTSLIGSTLSMALGMYLGFTSALLMGSLAYLLASRLQV